MRVVEGCTLGGVVFVMVLVVSSLMMVSICVSSSPIIVYRRYIRDSV